MRDKSIIGQQLFSICLVGLVIFGFTPLAVSYPLADRIQQFPQWHHKPSLKPATGDLEYPQWMAGTWNVTSTLVQQIAPLAPELVTPGFADNRDNLDRPFEFQVRFLADTGKNKSIVADRAFNGENITKAYLGEDSLYRVKVDPKNPNRQITLLKQERQLVSQITGRSSQTPQSDKFIASEYTQQLFKSPLSIYLNEVETTSAYQLLEPGKVTAEQITAIYLSPQDPDYFRSRDRPVALYRYHLDLERAKSALKLDPTSDRDTTGEIMTFTGTIEKKGFGFGTWALVTDAGETYELKDPPKELQQSSIKVEIQGRIREDVMTIAMIGPVLEIESFKLIDN
jgi:hypothetical protein